jgi:DNA-binding response OmpR family regulator
MKTPLLLLLTNDPTLEDAVAQALSEAGGFSHLTRCASDALRTVCGAGPDLDLAVIDFEHTGHGLSLVSAISLRREDLPIIVVRRDDEKYVETLAYASGAVACLTKPVTATEISAAIRQFCRRKPQEALVA